MDAAAVVTEAVVCSNVLQAVVIGLQFAAHSPGPVAAAADLAGAVSANMLRHGGVLLHKLNAARHGAYHLILCVSSIVALSVDICAKNRGLTVMCSKSRVSACRQPGSSSRQ